VYKGIDTSIFGYYEALDNNSCPNRKSNRKKKQWLKTFGSKITDRLNSLAVNAGLDNKDTLALMQASLLFLKPPSPS
jgi:hypothetical protein